MNTEKFANLDQIFELALTLLFNHSWKKENNVTLPSSSQGKFSA
jgi:hypothetical protein